MTQRDIVQPQAELDSLFLERTDPVVRRFFDYESTENLDGKIDVLRKLNAGIKPAAIPNYYEILEKYPKDGEAWD